MNVSILWKMGGRNLIMPALITLLFVGFSSQSAFSQTYVNGDQAVEILKQEIEDLQDRGLTAYNAGNHKQAYDLGYQYRYVLAMGEKIQTGSTVANAIEAALPTIPFVIGNVETGLTHTDSQMDLRRTQLRNYGINLLKE